MKKNCLSVCLMLMSHDITNGSYDKAHIILNVAYDKLNGAH